MRPIEEVIVLTKNYTVLYVEDEASIRDNVVESFERLFKRVVVAVDGSDGLEKFQKNHIDFIITDIQMPKMDGLEMIQAIRKQSKDIPIIITTAFVEQSFFIKSIDLKVDKYLLKPIVINQTMEALYDISKLLLDRSRAKELEVLLMKEKINKISDQLITAIADAIPNPCIIFNADEVRYINDAFCKLFQENEFEKFMQKSMTIDNLFDKNKDFISSLSEYDSNNPNKNKVSIKRKKGRKIYTIVKRDINIDGDANLSQMYSFNDVTWEEYQKIKIKNYSELLEEVIFKNRYHVSPKQEVTSVEYTKETVETIKMNISDSENALLRRSHVHKTTASEYVLELDGEILSDLQELDQLGKEFKYSAKIFQEDKDIVVIDEITEYLSKYAHVIKHLFEFEDLSYAIESLSKLLNSIKDKHLDDKDIKKIALFLVAIESDLSDWYQFIFIEKDAQDIHYLDSSLFSACLQIELILSNDVKEMQSDDDEFELF